MTSPSIDSKSSNEINNEAINNKPVTLILYNILPSLLRSLTFLFLSFLLFCHHTLRYLNVLPNSLFIKRYGSTVKHSFPLFIFFRYYFMPHNVTANNNLLKLQWNWRSIRHSIKRILAFLYRDRTMVSHYSFCITGMMVMAVLPSLSIIVFLSTHTHFLLCSQCLMIKLLTWQYKSPIEIHFSLLLYSLNYFYIFQ